jgi:hypothetical protein
VQLLRWCIHERRALFRVLLTWPVLIAALLVLSLSLSADQEGNIARDLANPFSSLWNVVNQINFNELKGGLFRESHTQFNWNLQPVMPIPLSDQFNLVNRPVFPYYENPFVAVTGAIVPLHVTGIIDIGINYQRVVKHPVDIEHQESIVRLTFTPVIPSPFAKKEERYSSQVRHVQIVIPISYQCAVEAVRPPDASSASDGRPSFASEAFPPPAKVTSLKAHWYQAIYENL